MSYINQRMQYVSVGIYRIYTNRWVHQFPHRSHHFEQIRRTDTLNSFIQAITYNQYRLGIVITKQARHGMLLCILEIINGVIALSFYSHSSYEFRWIRCWKPFHREHCWVIASVVLYVSQLLTHAISSIWSHSWIDDYISAMGLAEGHPMSRVGCN